MENSISNLESQINDLKTKIKEEEFRATDLRFQINRLVINHRNKVGSAT